ncbi:MAG: tetratricopeptide repeat protein [Beijerinckiaceae bacterium]
MFRAPAVATLLMAACLGGAAAARAQAPAPAQTEESVQSLFDEGRAAARAKDYQRSAELLYRALEALRRQGRGETVDGGLVSAYLASALDKADHPQTDQAFEHAFALLSRAIDLEPFIETGDAWLSRLHRLGRADEGAKVAEQLVQRLERAGTIDEARIAGMNVAADYLSAIGRKGDADKVMERVGPLLEAATPRAARIRGIARFGIAHDSLRDGRIADFTKQIEGAVDDLRRAMPDSSKHLAAALNLRGKVLFGEGLYGEALPLFAESVAVEPENLDTFIEAASLQARVLSRMERNDEALAIVEKLVDTVERKTGADSRLAFAARLDRVEMLMNAGQRAQSLAALEKERERLGGKAKATVAAQYFDRLAAIEIEEEDYASAAKNAERAIEAYRTALPHVPVLQVEPMRKRARASEGLLDEAYADRAFRELIDLSVRIYRPDHPEVARDLNAYATFLQIAGRLDEAEALLRRALVGLERAYGTQGLKYAYGLSNLANVISAAGRRAEAATLLEQALAIVGDAPERAEARATLRMNYANALNFLGRAQDALKIVQQIHDDLPSIGERRERAAVNADMIGVLALAHLGRLEEAWGEGLKTLNRIPVRTKEDAQNAVSLLLQMGDVARRAGDDKNALAATAEASRLMTSRGVETSYLWREWAQVALPSLWRSGQP